MHIEKCKIERLDLWTKSSSDTWPDSVTVMPHERDEALILSDNEILLTYIIYIPAYYRTLDSTGLKIEVYTVDTIPLKHFKFLLNTLKSH